MYTKTAALALLIAYAEARFGQEQIPVAAIQALGDFGNPGEAATLAGQVPSALLAGSSSCDKLSLADEIVDTLGDDPEVIAAAQALVGAEKNTNPFAVDIPNICDDATLPANEVLRGIVPLIDPDTVGADVQNANAAQSLQTPFDADGLSVAEISIEQGFDNFNLQDAAGATTFAGGVITGVGADTEADEDADADADEDADADVDEDVDEDDTGNEDIVECGAAPANDEADADDGADTGAVGDGITTSSIAGLDFGVCVPTIDLQGGRANRPDDEFTFLSTDPFLTGGQQEALNPGIITNFVCDQLTNVCEANDAAKEACAQIQAELDADGNPREAETAQRFNAALGFENAAFQ